MFASLHRYHSGWKGAIECTLEENPKISRVNFLGCLFGMYCRKPIFGKQWDHDWTFEILPLYPGFDVFVAFLSLISHVAY